MNQFLPFIVIGLATGAVYGLAGMGVVITFKTSGILNFGYGSIAALDAFLFYFLYVEWNWSWPYAALVCLLVFAPLLGLLMELLARSLSDASETIKVVATVGMILIVEAIALLWHEANPPTFPEFLSQSTVEILGRKRHVGADHPVCLLVGSRSGVVSVLPVCPAGRASCAVSSTILRWCR